MAKTPALSVEKRFHDELIGLPRDGQKKVLRALTDLQRDPNYQAKPLEGVPGVWRRSVPPYRILFAPGPGWIHVYSVQHRQSVYQGRIATPQVLPGVPPGIPPDLPAAEEDSAEPNISAASTLGVAPSFLEGGISWDTVAKVVACRTADDLYQLIDLGLPGPLFDRLYAQLTAIPTTPTASASLRLVREHVIDAFFGPLIALSRSVLPQEVVVVAPWITPWDGKKSSFAAFLRYVAQSKARTTIVTRPAELPTHLAAVAALKKRPEVEIIELADLHAKFFVCDIAPIPFGLIGSANSTARSYANYEVGVAIRGTGEAESLIRDLQSLATELRGRGRRIKKRGEIA